MRSNVSSLEAVNLDSLLSLTSPPLLLSPPPVSQAAVHQVSTCIWPRHVPGVLSPVRADVRQSGVAWSGWRRRAGRVSRQGNRETSARQGSPRDRLSLSAQTPSWPCRPPTTWAHALSCVPDPTRSSPPIPEQIGRHLPHSRVLR